MLTHAPIGLCDCGRPVVFRQPSGSGAHREVACECGRRHDVELGAKGWTTVAQLTPERSVPLSGFSKELRQATDSERFRFPFPLRGDLELPVHILFSRAERKAEIKAADLKVFSLTDVRLPTDARRRWIAWWKKTTLTSRRSKGGSFSPPRRVGRLPVSMIRRARVGQPAH